MGFSSGKKPRTRQKVKPFQPAPGTDFGQVIEVEARTRDFLARFIAVSTGAAVAVTGAISLYTNNYTPIAAVWAVVGPIVGALVTYYFGAKRNNTG